MACKTSFLAIFVQCRTAVVFSEMTSSTALVDISFLSWSYSPLSFPLLLPWRFFCVTFFTYFGAPMDSIWLFTASWTLPVSYWIAKVAPLEFSRNLQRIHRTLHFSMISSWTLSSTLANSHDMACWRTQHTNWSIVSPSNCCIWQSTCLLKGTFSIGVK